MRFIILILVFFFHKPYLFETFDWQGLFGLLVVMIKLMVEILGFVDFK